MRGPERVTPPAAVRFEPAVGARVAKGPFDIASRIADATWTVFHATGAHRWRDGYETDLERGWTRYRGSRCAICDEPWEGW